MPIRPAKPEESRNRLDGSGVATAAETVIKVEYDSIAGLDESRLITIRLSKPVGSLVGIGLPFGSRIRKEN